MKARLSNINQFIFVFLCTSLLACGGDEEATAPDPSAGQPSQIGSGSGTNFNPGQIAIPGVQNGAQLAPGGSTTMSVTIVDNLNQLITSDVMVSFYSNCVANGFGAFTDNTGAINNEVTTTNGQASITFKDLGCATTDTVTARATIDDKTITAQSQLSIARDTIQSIQFIDAVPNKISLKGTGSQETSLIRFAVTGSTGIAVINAPVTLSLNTDVGGLCLSDKITQCVKSLDTLTDSSGIASATVLAGTIAAPVRITATDKVSNTSTQSNELIVSTGIPDQDSMSLFVDIANPEAWEKDLSTVKLTVSLADAFNNPPPRGTSVSFWTEGGKIDPGCTTDEFGNCPVTWQSSNPRPVDGRITILAFAQGNESFSDVNGNGYFDASDVFDSVNDLGEAYLDENENGIFDQGVERFVDYNKDGLFTYASNSYNGVMCQNESDLCSKAGITIRLSTVLVMSSSSARSITLDRPVVITKGQIFAGKITVEDLNGNSMPYGSKLSVIDSSAKGVAIELVSNTVPSEIGPNKFDLVIVSDSDADVDPSGSFTIRVTAPNGTVSSQLFQIN